MNGLRRLRERQLLTQAQLAARMGLMRHQTISSWERGDSRPRPSSMAKLCAALDVSSDELLAALDPRADDRSPAAWRKRDT